mgnify:CR=1 FL=1
MSYYKCMRCNHIFTYKTDMIRHLNKKNKCIIMSNNEKSENQLYNESLIKINIEDGLNLDIKIVAKKYTCDICKNKFYNKSNLKRHKETSKSCKKNSISETPQNIQNISIQNTFHNTYNIHINNLRGFDEDWDVSRISHDMRKLLLMSDTKFTNTLKNILENKNNINIFQLELIINNG